jgi:hypothetical protein
MLIGIGISAVQISAVQRHLWDVYSAAWTEKHNGCGKRLKGKMCGICGTLWILVQLDPTCFSHIDHSNGSCNKTATSIPIDTVSMSVCMCTRPPLFYCTKLNSSFKSDVYFAFILRESRLFELWSVYNASCWSFSDSYLRFTYSKHNFMEVFLSVCTIPRK